MPVVTWLCRSCAGGSQCQTQPFQPVGDQGGELVDVLVTQGIISHAGPADAGALSLHPASTIASRGLGLCQWVAAFLLHSELWVLPKRKLLQSSSVFSGSCQSEPRESWRWQEGSCHSSSCGKWGLCWTVSPEDCQGSCQRQGMLTSGTAEDQSRFYSTSLLLLPALWKQADSQLSPWNHQGFFFHKEKPCSAFNQHFPGILFLVLTSVQQCRMEGSVSLALICYFHITWAWPPSLVFQSLNHVWLLAAVPDLW